MAIRRGLHARGFGYRLHAPELLGRPDIVFPRYRAVVLVNGCFWHGHDCALFRLPGTRRDFWQAKIDCNRERDAEVAHALYALGWRRLTVWECAMRGPGRRARRLSRPYRRLARRRQAPGRNQGFRRVTPADFDAWMAQCSRPGTVWYAKRLSANDTLANRAHQAGAYIPKAVLFGVLPVLNSPERHNPYTRFPLRIDSHGGGPRTVRAIWYNNRLRGGTRNEARVTGFGGRGSPLLDPESTGAITVFAFVPGPGGTAAECRVWVCGSQPEEELFEQRLGPLEPGRWTLWSPEAGPLPAVRPEPAAPCRLSEEDMPPDWLSTFPTGAEIVAESIRMRPERGRRPDDRLLRRRNCEYEIFLSVEETVEMPRIRQGFGSIDEFVSRAQTILQRRKARAGRSLELQAKEVFREEGLRESIDFDHDVESEPGRRPDFLFPSQARYHDSAYPSDRLRMLAVKTTCRDRWRQILNEARRIPTKHLLTVQEGVSERQFREMKDSRVRLVVPSRLWSHYPATVRPELVSVEAFIAETRRIAH